MSEMRLLEIAAQLIRSARLARIIARDRQTVAELAAGVLEAADIVTLPAVDGDGNFGQGIDGFFGVYTQGPQSGLWPVGSFSRGSLFS